MGITHAEFGPWGPMAAAPASAANTCCSTKPRSGNRSSCIQVTFDPRRWKPASSATATCAPARPPSSTPIRRGRPEGKLHHHRRRRVGIPDQHVHIVDTPGFNIGAAGQPPGCRNSLHSPPHGRGVLRAEGRWRFFWGRWGTAGEVIAEEGDIFNIPTGIFRAFENVGTDYGMIMAILGGDDAGGGVIWAPQVITDAKDYGLMLGKNGKLYDTKKGQPCPKACRRCRF
jgi:hypothetical protein